jgi:hypothetical protein
VKTHIRREEGTDGRTERERDGGRGGGRVEARVPCAAPPTHPNRGGRGRAPEAGSHSAGKQRRSAGRGRAGAVEGGEGGAKWTTKRGEGGEDVERQWKRSIERASE